MTYGWQLTREYLKSVISYNPDTGEFKWLSFKPGRKRSLSAGDMDVRGYMRIGINRQRYPSHRLAWFYMTGEWPKLEIDHINHDKADNRWSNLREVTRKENSRNQARRRTNRSGINGVSWDRARNKWYACIKHNGKSVSLGRHESLEDAKAAIDRAKNTYNYHSNHGGCRNAQLV